MMVTGDDRRDSVFGKIQTKAVMLRYDSNGRQTVGMKGVHSPVAILVAATWRPVF